MTEWTVLSSTDQASLWKQMMTLVDGRLSKYRPGSLHLKFNSPTVKDWPKPGATPPIDADGERRNLMPIATRGRR